MKIVKILLLIIFLNFYSGNIEAQYIQVTDNITPEDLVRNTLINSPCANVSNFSATSGNFGTGQQSFGHFIAGTSGFAFSEGIVLSTSRAVITHGPNDSLLSDDANGWVGDLDLETALGISNTTNATILEFDFTPLTSQVSFDYLFASEEYHGSAPCVYSDGFAFLLKVAGTSSPYQNLALVPGTNIPVKVTSVHPEIPGSCPAENETYFGSFNGVNVPINFDGQTVIMTAKATVIPGTTYHIKLVIADEQNYKYDSAIFLGGGTFQVGTDLGPDKLIATNNPICFGESYILDATEAGINSYKWFRNGILQTQTTPTFMVTDSGIYKVEVTLGGTTCIAKGEVTIEYSALPVLSDAILVQCDDNNDGFTIFNLNKVNALVTNANASLNNIVYYETLLNAENQIDPITNPSFYQNLVPNQKVFARVTNSFGCTNYAEVDLVISNNSLNPHIVTSCDLDNFQDGFTVFDFNNQVTPNLLLGLPSGLVVEYYLNMNDAILQTNILSNSFTNTIANQQVIFARIVNGPDCYGIVVVNLKINTFNPSNFQDETLIICNGVAINLAVASGFSTYLWSNGSVVNFISVSIPGTYSVTVTNSDNCSKTKNFIVIGSETATITSIETNDFEGNNNSVLVNYTGNGIYSFSIDGINFQTSNLFTNVSIGVYNITIRDKYECGDAVSKTIYVLDYPKYFTPNNDGLNDFWKIDNLNNLPFSKIYIYDRFGRFIKQISPNGCGWDGTYNNVQLPADDYWFYINLEYNKIIKSHFALKR